MKNALVSLLCGILFSLGLGIAGMTQPEKVTAFLDFSGDWDPSLLFVMAGAILVYAIGYRLVIRKNSPICAEDFQIPANRAIDRRLIFGAILFGTGWGMAGFCPGPALTSLVSLELPPLIFVAAMLFGMALFEGLQRLTGSSDKR